MQNNDSKIESTTGRHYWSDCGQEPEYWNIERQKDKEV